MHTELPRASPAAVNVADDASEINTVSVAIVCAACIVIFLLIRVGLRKRSLSVYDFQFIETLLQHVSLSPSRG